MLDVWNLHVQLTLLTVLNTLEGLLVIAIEGKCKYVNSKFSCTYTWYSAKNKEVPDRNFGVPLVRWYANYRTLSFREVARA